MRPDPVASPSVPQAIMRHINGAHSQRNTSTATTVNARRLKGHAHPVMRNCADIESQVCASLDTTGHNKECSTESPCARRRI